MPDSPAFIKDPGAELPYTFDWTDWLGNENIASRTTTVPSGITRIGSDQVTNKTTTVTIGGGTHGKDYLVTDAIVTTPSALKDERTIIIRVKNR